MEFFFILPPPGYDSWLMTVYVIGPFGLISLREIKFYLLKSFGKMEWFWILGFAELVHAVMHTKDQDGNMCCRQGLYLKIYALVKL